MGEKILRIFFDKIDGFIKINDGIRHLLLIKYNKIYDRIRYLLSEKSGIKDSISYNFVRIKIDSYNSLPTEKILTFHNVTILVKSIVNKIENNNCYNLFFKKGLCKDKSNTQTIYLN